MYRGAGERGNVSACFVVGRFDAFFDFSKVCGLYSSSAYEFAVVKRGPEDGSPRISAKVSRCDSRNSVSRCHHSNSLFGKKIGFVRTF